MNNIESKRGREIVSVLRSDSVVGVGKEYLELGIDAALDSGALKEIPLVSTVVGIFNVASTFKDRLLTAKLIRFINQLSDTPQQDRVKMIERLNENGKFSGRAGSALIEILDRMESEKKPEIAAKCFAAYAKEEISFEELRRILLALERVPSFDIEQLVAFSKAKLIKSAQIDESTLLAYVNAGLGVNNGGFDGGVIVPTKLCELFIKIGLAS
jgi:hypothetical protein